jgi:hypothetical protein
VLAGWLAVLYCTVICLFDEAPISYQQSKELEYYCTARRRSESDEIVIHLLLSNDLGGNNKEQQ